MGELVGRVSENFEELEIFRGRYLRHIYDHKREVELNQKQIQRDCAKEIKNAGPLFTLQEYRKMRVEKSKQMEAVKKKYNIHLDMKTLGPGCCRQVCKKKQGLPEPVIED